MVMTYCTVRVSEAMVPAAKSTMTLVNIQSKKMPNSHGNRKTESKRGRARTHGQERKAEAFFFDQSFKWKK